MSPQRFRTKPVEIEAFKYTGIGEEDENFYKLNDWAENNFALVDIDDRGDDPEIIAEIYDKLHSTWVGVKTGQWIVRGAKGEYYPCDDETFHWKYEEVI